jgi:hypothetical protein
VEQPHRACWRDRPSRWLALTSIAVVGPALLFPFTPWAAAFVLPPDMLALVIGLTIAYLALSEAVKHLFYRFVRAP